MTDTAYFDNFYRFVLPDFARKRPFASFLPGIAGPQGIPMWVFYVNRGQGIASFGIENKDNPMVEFQPANKAYQQTPFTGFRTFVKQVDGMVYEPFAPHAQTAVSTQMTIGMNELLLQEINAVVGLRANVRYFTLPGEPFAALVRQLTLTNLTQASQTWELVDGLASLIPYGVTDALLKGMSRTLEAWMEVFNLAQNLPFYRLRASAADTAEVTAFQAGHFYMAFVEGELQPLPVIADPVVLFGADTSLSWPFGLQERPLPDLFNCPQVVTGKTPCAFAGTTVTLAAGASITLHSVIGHAPDLSLAQQYQKRLQTLGYLAQKHDEAVQLAQSLTDPIATETAVPLFDAYCRQTLLDNILRGGWPLPMGAHIVHIYSRKHGDLERDYNAFALAAEPYSQGNGNYRDVNQNRRNDVLFQPQVAAFNIRVFCNLLQTDGYNPLVVNGSRLAVTAEKREALAALANGAEVIRAVFARPFTLGYLLKIVHDYAINLTVSEDEFLARVLQTADVYQEAIFGEGFWSDHWTYNLDLIENYLAVYPDCEENLLFGDPTYTFYDSPAWVRPRHERYVLAAAGPRQFNAVQEDEAKAALIAARTQYPHLTRGEYGQGDVVQVTLFAKLVLLALAKFATLDPSGMGIEMEAGRPGWYDALNGLPGLFGSGMPETFELDRLLTFLQQAISRSESEITALPQEMVGLLQQVHAHLSAYLTDQASDRDFVYWDRVSTDKEAYRQQTRLGLNGRLIPVSHTALAQMLTAFQAKVQEGVQRALDMNGGIPPTYFRFTVTDYECRSAVDENGRTCIRPLAFQPHLLPLFLEGPTRALKCITDREKADVLHQRIQASDLFDTKLQLYKVNASLQGQPHDIGRAHAFTPGWLENESVWMHMAFKYALALLDAGLYAAFYDTLQHLLPPFMDAATYGRSPLENVSFIVSSAHPDASLHGAGFVARLSGSTAEFLSMWTRMMIGKRPFFVQDGELCLALRPLLPGWLFQADGTLAFTFLGQCRVTYHNPDRVDTFMDLRIQHMTLHRQDGQIVSLLGAVIPAPYAAAVRAGEFVAIDAYFA